MPYNRKNHLKKVQHAIDIYNQYKTPDIPDTTIVRVYFPKHDIHISYRTWTNWKGTVVPREEKQLSLF